MQLRPYQLAAIDRVRAQLRANKRRVLLVAPTGAGKTVIAAAVVLAAYERGSRVIVLAHRRELIDQTFRKLGGAGIPEASIGVMMADDQRARAAAPVQVASIDTFRHREPPPADLVIIDEAHRSLAQGYVDVVEHYADAVLLGLTATPYRADGGGLGAVYEALELVATPAELIADGFLAEPRVFSAAQKLDLSAVRVRAGEYVEADLAEACSKLVGGIVEHWLRHAEGRRTVAFAINVAHSRAIVDAFVQAGIAAEHLDGATPTQERDAILARLERGETAIVGNCGVLCEGWDQPAVKCAILARPTVSTGLYLQQAGRILRPWEGVRPIILDHAGNALAHGLPQDTRTFALHAQAPKKGERAPAATTKECSACCAVVARSHSTCPECSHAFAQESAIDLGAEGELEEVDADAHARRRAAWEELVQSWQDQNEARAARGEKPLKPGVIWHRWGEQFDGRPPAGCRLPLEIASEDEKRQAYADLRAQAARRGYKPGWAAHRFKQRFGAYPARSRVAGGA